MHFFQCEENNSASVHAILKETILVNTDITGAIYTNVSLFFLGSHRIFSSPKPNCVTFQLNGDIAVDVNKKAFQKF